MKFFNLAVICCGLGLLACGGDDEGPGDNACNYIVGQTYNSIVLRECGAGRPDCNWYVTFNANMTYFWSFSDQTRENTYSCSGLRIKSGSTTIGRFDPATGVLTWNDVEYR